MRIVAALGGNALLLRDVAPDADAQERHVRDAAEALSPLVVGHELVVTHGNGPQVGVLAFESAADPALMHPYPFDVAAIGRLQDAPGLLRGEAGTIVTRGSKLAATRPSESPVDVEVGSWAP